MITVAGHVGTWPVHCFKLCNSMEEAMNVWEHLQRGNRWKLHPFGGFANSPPHLRVMMMVMIMIMTMTTATMMMMALMKLVSSGDNNGVENCNLFTDLQTQAQPLQDHFSVLVCTTNNLWVKYSPLFKIQSANPSQSRWAHSLGHFVEKHGIGGLNWIVMD